MDSYGVSAEEQQAILAQALRSQAALRENSAQGSRFNNMAAIAQMANNPSAAKAAAGAAASAQKQFTPDQMGNQGFALPGMGEFAPSPMFLQEQATARAQQRGLAADRQQSLAELQQQRLESQKQLQQARLEAQKQRAADANALRLMIAEMNRGKGVAAQGDTQEKVLSADTKKLSASLEKAGAAEFADALDIVKGTLGRYPDGKLPGYGRLLGAVPGALLDENSQTVRADMQQAANILLKARSGAAVTESEMRRFLTEIASGAGMSEKALRHGWGNVERTFGARLNNLLAGASPDVYSTYVAQGGRDFRGGKTKEAEPAGLPPGLVLPPGAKYIGPAK